ncbi:MAG: class IV adenylate cyclase [Pseudonocardia sp.]
MSIEAELKARVRNPERVRDLLQRHAREEVSTYSDTYFDTAGRELTRDGRELRVRAVDSGGVASTVLTYKSPSVDEGSGSKPETETTVADADALRAILNGLGFEVLIAFEKHCMNYRFTVADRPLLATLVQVPELAGTYLEIESIVTSDAEIAPALETIRAVFSELGIEHGDETTETYTEAVSAIRSA